MAGQRWCRGESVVPYHLTVSVVEKPKREREYWYNVKSLPRANKYIVLKTQQKSRQYESLFTVQYCT